MIVYKLTTKTLTTYKDFQWELDKTCETSGNGDLCGPGWLHAYHSPELAVLLNPINSDIKNPRLFEAIGDGEYKDDNGLKCGFTKLTLVKELSLPEFTLEQKVKFGILCSLEVYREPSFVEWAKKWISGEDRSGESAGALDHGAGFFDNEASYAASYASYASYAAACAESAETYAASAVAYAAYAVAYAAYAVANGATYNTIDFERIIRNI